MRRLALRSVAIVYLLVVLLGPLSMVFWRTFENGFGDAWDALTTPETIHAFKVTLIIAAIAVPVNTVFGVVCALAIVRQRFPGKGIVNALVDLPLALSPVVVGLSLFLLYGQDGWFGGWLERHESRCSSRCRRWCSSRSSSRFPSSPARSCRPCGRSATSRSRLPARSAPPGGRPSGGSRSLDPLGRRLRRRAHDGALPGRVRRRRGRLGPPGGADRDATLRVEERYENFDLAGAYAISLVLAAIAVVVLLAMTLIKPREETA